MTKLGIQIKGMSCDHCVKTVRRELEYLEGVRVYDVRIGQASVEFDETRIQSEQLDRAVQRAGYSVVSKATQAG